MSSKYTSKVSLLALAITLMVLAGSASGVRAQSEPPQVVFELESPEWTFDLSIYGLLMGIDGTVGGNALVNGERTPVEMDFGQLTEYSNPGGGLRFEAHKDRWSMLTDFEFLNVDAEQTVRNPEDSRETALAQNKMKQIIGELSGFYLFAEHWEFLVSMRAYSFDNDLKVGDIQVLDGRESWVDIFTGFRFRSPVWDTWLMSFRFDVGTGGSKVSTYADLRARYFFGGGVKEGFWGEVGLRSNYMNREDGHPTFEDYFKYSATTTGFFLGLGYSF